MFIGQGIGYHGVTLGFYQDALLKRVDTEHRSLSQFFDEEIAKPLGTGAILFISNFNYR